MDIRVLLCLLLVPLHDLDVDMRTSETAIIECDSLLEANREAFLAEMRTLIGKEYTTHQS